MNKPDSLHHLDRETEQLMMGRSMEPTYQPSRWQMVIEKTPAGLQVSYRWFSYAHVLGGFILVLLIFDRFQVSPILNGLLLQAHPAISFENFWVVISSILLDLIIPICLGYWVLAGIINSTSILVDDCDLSIHNGPLPWPGNRRIRSCEISQLFVRQVKQGRSFYKLSNYRLGAQTMNGKEVTLLEQNSPELAWLIRSRLESQLSAASQPTA